MESKLQVLMQTSQCNGRPRYRTEIRLKSTKTVKMNKVNLFCFFMLSFYSRALYATLMLTGQERKPCETGLLVFTQWIRFFLVCFGASRFFQTCARKTDMKWQITVKLKMVFRFFMWNRLQEDNPSRENCDGKAQILPQFKGFQRATRKKPTWYLRRE